MSINFCCTCMFVDADWSVCPPDSHSLSKDRVQLVSVLEKPIVTFPAFCNIAVPWAGGSMCSYQPPRRPEVRQMAS